MNLRQAELFVEQYRSDARHGRLSLPAGRKLSQTCGELCDSFLTKLREIDGRDIINNEQHIRLHIKPLFGAMRVDRISEFTVQKFQALCRKKGLSEATCTRILATWRRMSRPLVAWKLLAHPFPMIKLAAERNARERVLSDAEIAALLQAALDDSNNYIWLFVKVALATSLRHSEILSARWKHFHPEARRLRVKVKGGHYRSQPLTASITKILERERAMAGEDAVWIFPSGRAQGGHMTSLRWAFARCVARPGLDPKDIVPHVLRHTAIIRMAALGVDIKTLQQFSGHQTLAMVMRYTHAREQALEAALSRFDADNELATPTIDFPTPPKLHQAD
jgi:integrase